MEYINLRDKYYVTTNDYETKHQYIRKDETIENQVPEFININNTNGIPNIQISIV